MPHRYGGRVCWTGCVEGTEGVEGGEDEPPAGLLFWRKSLARQRRPVKEGRKLSAASSAPCRPKLSKRASLGERRAAAPDLSVSCLPAFSGRYADPSLRAARMTFAAPGRQTSGSWRVAELVNAALRADGGGSPAAGADGPAPDAGCPRRGNQGHAAVSRPSPPALCHRLPREPSVGRTVEQQPSGVLDGQRHTVVVAKIWAS